MQLNCLCKKKRDPFYSVSFFGTVLNDEFELPFIVEIVNAIDGWMQKKNLVIYLSTLESFITQLLCEWVHQSVGAITRIGYHYEIFDVW